MTQKYLNVRKTTFPASKKKKEKHIINNVEKNKLNNVKEKKLNNAKETKPIEAIKQETLILLTNI